MTAPQKSFNPGTMPTTFGLKRNVIEPWEEDGAADEAG